MKSFLSFATLVTAIVMIGCSSDSTTSPSGSSMTAKIDGMAFSGSLSTLGTMTNGVLGISGTSNNSYTISIAIPSAAVQTFTIGLGASSATVSVATGVTADKLYSANIITGSGTITVTELSATRAKGTFAVVAQNNAGATVTVTEGMFDVKL